MGEPHAGVDADVFRFREDVIAWGRVHGRTFGWRLPGRSTFELLLTEVLLARTRADAVVPVLERLLGQYPDAVALAAGSLDDLEAIVRPLGLYRKRARALVPLARALVARHGGHPPVTIDELMALPYVGRYAANAFLSFARGRAVPVVDANVARLFERYWGLAPAKGKLDAAEPHWQMAARLLPSAEVALYNWTLLDLGALICKPRKTACDQCPLRASCPSTSPREDVKSRQ